MNLNNSIIKNVQGKGSNYICNELNDDWFKASQIMLVYN